ncbi:MAG: 3-oxoacyl-ACP reductase family protein [Acidimicrobiales bacterium]
MGASISEVPAFVTGAGRGIGAEIARRLAAGGAPVAIGYRRQADQAEAVAISIREKGGTALCVGADVSDPDEVDAAFARIEAELGPVGVLVNNAGLHIGGRIQAFAVEDWHRVVGTCLTGAFLCARRAVPEMVARRGGRIVNVTSVVGVNGYPGDAAYASAKAGMIGLTKALALELARDGIAVNAVAPGFVDTEMTRALAPSVLEQVARSIPARRQGSTEEIAQAVEFLVTGPEYITGTVLTIDGGWTIA